MGYRFAQTISFSPLVQALYLVALIVFVWIQFQVVPELPWIPMAIGAGLLILPAMFGRLVLEVDEGAVTARFGYLGWPAQRVPLSHIERARIVSYRPIRQFGGWGIRVGRFEGEKTSVYSVRGTRGVLLELTEPRRISGARTRRFLLGSGDPERLVAAIGKG
jgi:hypothetical protein